MLHPLQLALPLDSGLILNACSVGGAAVATITCTFLLGQSILASHAPHSIKTDLFEDKTAANQQTGHHRQDNPYLGERYEDSLGRFAHQQL